ncbi:MAG: AAA family ATPase, partial [Erysipelotrichia bacterium]|nr:AAA family ATPase [Erysipelotrichia bacterium]
MEKVAFNFVLSEEAKKEKEELVERLKQEPFIMAWLEKYQLPFTYVSEHAYQFKDYIERKKLCESCSALSQCRQKTQGYVMELSYQFALEKSLCPCRYMQNKQRLLAHKRKFMICDMSEEQLMHRFQNIDLANEKASYVALVNEMLNVCDTNKKEGFYLCGEPGSGKTYLACCFANEMAHQGKKVSFVNVSHYFSTLKAKMYDKDAFTKQIDALRLADVIILDDIGGESASNWSRDEILLPILNERME